jgi:hypothetical protein
VFPAVARRGRQDHGMHDLIIACGCVAVHVPYWAFLLPLIRRRSSASRRGADLPVGNSFPVVQAGRPHSLWARETKYAEALYPSHRCTRFVEMCAENEGTRTNRRFVILCAALVNSRHGNEMEIYRHLDRRNAAITAGCNINELLWSYKVGLSHYLSMERLS